MRSDARFTPKSGHLSALALTPKTLAERTKIKSILSYNWLTNFLKVFCRPVPMKKKSELYYELYGSSENGSWRWAIFAGREQKPLLVGSFHGTLPDAKKHAEAAVLRLKERAQKHKSSSSK